MNDRIFGYSWEDIQARQMGTHKPDLVDLSRDPNADLAKHAEMDAQLLNEHGSIEALEAAGLHGVTDRIRRRQNNASQK